jgi:hypothetical protein
VSTASGSSNRASRRPAEAGVHRCPERLQGFHRRISRGGMVPPLARIAPLLTPVIATGVRGRGATGSQQWHSPVALVRLGLVGGVSPDPLPMIGIIVRVRLGPI